MKYVFAFLKAILWFIALCLAASALWVAYVYFFIEVKTPQEIAPAESKSVSISNGEQVWYQEISHASPTTVVFVGGLSGWSKTWSRSIKELDSKNLGYNLIALDLPPFGFSSTDPNADFFRSTQARRIQEFIIAKGIKNVIFVAHSYGAGPVTEAVMTNPGDYAVQKLIIIDGVLNIDEPARKPLAPALDRVTQKRPLEYFVMGVSHAVSLVKRQLGSFVFDKRHIDRELAKIYMESFRLRGSSAKLSSWLHDYLRDPMDYVSTKGESYAELRMPVRIIWGDQDTLTPPRLAAQLASLVPDSDVFMLKSVGHIPMIEDYQQFDDALYSALLR
jgi:pimeloyl-ACP methyl ester carboxylesterase